MFTYDEALAGFQPDVPIETVTGAVPSFFRYNVFEIACPGSIVPQLMAVSGVVHPLSENALIFIVFTLPELLSENVLESKPKTWGALMTINSTVAVIKLT